MSLKSPIFEETYKNYLAQVAGIDLASRAPTLEIRLENGEALIPLFGNIYRVSSRGVFDPSGLEPDHAVKVTLCKYLLLCPETEPIGEEWVSYKDFKAAAPFVGGFINNTEKALVRHFSGSFARLREACRTMGSRPAELEVSYQLALRFEALPKIPILLLFNDEDEEFPAQCSLLFQKKAEGYLDMECLAILGWVLTDGLLVAAGIHQPTIM
jgi:hypothetical protein